MANLQQVAFNALPKDIKDEILQNPGKYLEYDILARVNLELIRYSNKEKMSVKKKELIALSQIFINVNTSILAFPPATIMFGAGPMNVMSWGFQDFIQRYNYNFIYEDSEQWTKFMLLLYFTYHICYTAFYDLYQRQEWSQYVLPLDRNTNSFLIYMFMTYKHLDTSLTKRQLKDIFSTIYSKEYTR